MLLLLACNTLKPSDTSTPTSAEPLDLDGVLSRTTAKNDGYGGSILRAESRDGMRYLGAAGDRTHNGTPIDVSDEFEIASITKTFTAVTTLLLIEENQLTLDTPLKTALPEWDSGLLVIQGQDKTGEITLRQLLSHTSGLPDYWSDPPFVQGQSNAFLRAFLADETHFWTPDEILGYIKNLTPIHAPGGEWHYSDTNYVVLGLIIERAEGKALHDVMRERIFDPLGMDHTWMSFHEDRPFPESHRYEGSWDMTDKTHQSADWAGGGLVSTAHDLSVFLHALAQGNILKSSSLDDLLTTVPTDTRDVYYGLGVFVVDFEDGDTLWGHDGYGSSFMYLHTADNTVFTGTVNQTDTDWWPLVEAGL